MHDQKLWHMRISGVLLTITCYEFFTQLWLNDLLQAATFTHDKIEISAKRSVQSDLRECILAKILAYRHISLLCPLLLVLLKAGMADRKYEVTTSLQRLHTILHRALIIRNIHENHIRDNRIEGGLMPLERCKEVDITWILYDI